jgi:hypothetical protein
VKGKKLKQLEDAYGQVVKLKQAEPAICALYKIGLGYKHFAQALYAVPMPKEYRGKQEYEEEYKAGIAQYADPLEQKAVEGLELAMNASRDYGVVNACAREATAILLKYKPDRYGPSPEVISPLAAPQAVSAPAGYGVLAEVQPVAAAAAKAPRRAAEPALPPLRSGTAAVRPADAVEPADPQRRVIEDEPAPTAKKHKKKGSSTDEDEDLLP